MGRTYSDPTFGANHVVGLGKIGSNATAGTALARFATYMTGKVTEVFAVVHAVGTATNAGWTIKLGTTSIGALTAGMSAAGSIVAASLTDTDVTPTDVLNLHNVTSDTSLEAFIYVVYQEAFS